MTAQNNIVPNCERNRDCSCINYDSNIQIDTDFLIVFKSIIINNLICRLYLY